MVKKLLSVFMKPTLILFSFHRKSVVNFGGGDEVSSANTRIAKKCMNNYNRKNLESVTDVNTKAMGWSSRFSTYER